MVGCAVSGILGWTAARHARWPVATLASMMGLVLAAIAVQLVSLPAGAIQRISPATVDTVRQLDVAYGAGVRTSHALSIYPPGTWSGLALAASFFVMILGTARLLSIVGTRWLVWSLTVLGVILALIGIVQKAVYSGQIYGFWTPLAAHAEPFGPFVNKNHFAGWMLMTLPLVLALLCAGIERGMARVRPNWHDRLLWLATGALVMALSLVMTMSRSGISALGLAVLITAGFVARGVRHRGRRAVVGVYLLGLVICIGSWAGVETIVTRFSKTDWSEFDDRRGAWTDAWQIARRVPLTGTGVNTYGMATLLLQEHNLSAHYVQAHNDYLQLLAEGGVLVVVPAALLLWGFSYAVWRRFLEDEVGRTSSWTRAGAVTGLVAIALQETVDFSLQMPGNAALCAVLCAMALHRPPARLERPLTPNGGAARRSRMSVRRS
jgi:O-antigen ligase